MDPVAVLDSEQDVSSIQDFNVLDYEPVLYALKRDQLRALCKQRGLKTVGEKKVLIARLLEYNSSLKKADSGTLGIGEVTASATKRRPTEVSFDFVDPMEAKEAQEVIAEFGANGDETHGPGLTSSTSSHTTFKNKLSRTFKYGSAKSGRKDDIFINPPQSSSTPLNSPTVATQGAQSNSMITGRVLQSIENITALTQHQNKSETRIRLVHTPNGIHTVADDAESVKLSLSPAKVKKLREQKENEPEESPFPNLNALHFPSSPLQVFGVSRAENQAPGSVSRTPNLKRTRSSTLLDAKLGSKSSKDTLRSRFDEAHDKENERLDSISKHPSTWRKPNYGDTVKEQDHEERRKSKRVKVDSAAHDNDKGDQFMDVDHDSDEKTSKRPLDDQKDKSIVQNLQKSGWTKPPRTPRSSMAATQARRRSAAKSNRKSIGRTPGKTPKMGATTRSDGVASRFFWNAVKSVRTTFTAGFGGSNATSVSNNKHKASSAQGKKELHIKNKIPPVTPMQRASRRTSNGQPGFTRPTAASINRANTNTAASSNNNISKTPSGPPRVIKPKIAVRRTPMSSQRISAASTASIRSARRLSSRKQSLGAVATPTASKRKESAGRTPKTTSKIATRAVPVRAAIPHQAGGLVAPLPPSIGHGRPRSSHSRARMMSLPAVPRGVILAQSRNTMQARRTARRSVGKTPGSSRRSTAKLKAELATPKPEHDISMSGDQTPCARL